MEERFIENIVIALFGKDFRHLIDFESDTSYMGFNELDVKNFWDIARKEKIGLIYAISQYVSNYYTTHKRKMEMRELNAILRYTKEDNGTRFLEAETLKDLHALIFLFNFGKKNPTGTSVYLANSTIANTYESYKTGERSGPSLAHYANFDYFDIEKYIEDEKIKVIELNKEDGNGKFLWVAYNERHFDKEIDIFKK